MTALETVKNAIRMEHITKRFGKVVANHDINLQLHKAYLPRIALWQKNRYERLVGEITSILKDIPEVQTEADLNTPLKDIYLMGYELQRNDFFTKKEKTETEEHENGNSEQ